jgi:hypothetical protein
MLWRRSFKHILFIVPVGHKICVQYCTWRKSTSSLDQKCASSFREYITRVLDVVV